MYSQVIIYDVLVLLVHGWATYISSIAACTRIIKTKRCSYILNHAPRGNVIDFKLCDITYARLH